MTALENLRVAVIGSGPAGFYAAGDLLKRGAEVDLFERLPTPWGLVRQGVAPDHPKIKAVSRVFEKIAAQPGFRFFGNVEIGRDLSADDLRRHYHAIVWSVGAQIDRRMGIEGEDLPGSLSATAFVAWYNGHPDYCDLEIDLDVERVVVVGNGNVALDCARMLALTREELVVTDTADVAIDAIADSPIREIVVLGRRGPVQAAFTTPELQELGELAGADVWVDPADMELDPASEAALAGEGMALPRRNVDVLRTYAGRERTGKPRLVNLRFLASPVELRGDGRVEEVVIARNRLEVGDDGSLRAVPTGETEVLPAGLVLRSVGYRGTPLEGVPFDERRHLIPNEAGRVLDADGAVLPGEYCAGWIKRGPSGVIGTNKKDATESIELLVEDAEAGRLRTPEEPSPEAIERLVWERADHVVEYSGWEAIDEHERGSGEPHGRPRVKLTRWEHLLDRARSASSTR
jgi:ferredoxin/flavodoxin---NADP+ reductase